jgi:hypothetical protein
MIKEEKELEMNDRGIIQNKMAEKEGNTPYSFRTSRIKKYFPFIP